MNFASICLVVLFTFVVKTERILPYELIELKPAPINFEKIGKGIFYKDVWTIFSKFTPMDFSNILDFIDRYDRQIEKLCGVAKEETTNKISPITTGLKNMQISCKLMVKETAIISKSLRENNEHIQHIFVQRRRKRSIDVIGNFAKWAFGTMDNEDAHKIYSKLSTLDKSGSQNYELIKHQITVMRSNFDKLSKPIETLEMDIKNITANLRQLGELYDAFTSKVEKEINQLLIKTEIYEMFSMINTQLLEIQNRQSTELSILNDLYQNKLHPFILDINNITETLNKFTISATIKPFFQNMFVLHQAAKVVVFPDGDSLFIKIIIPLPETTKYDIHKIHAVPVEFKEEWDLLLYIKNEYIAAAENHESFIMLSHEDFVNCIRVAYNSTSEIEICRLTSPTLTSGSTECLVELSQNGKTSEENCKYNAIPATAGVILKMIASNQWLYKLKKSTILNINCDGVHYVATLEGFGIIKFLKPCEFGNREMKLPYEKTIHTITEYKQIEVDHSVTMENLKLKYNNIRKTNLTSTRKKLPLTFGNHKEVAADLMEGKKSLEVLEKELNKVEESRKLSEQDWEIEIHRYSIISTSSLLTLFAIITVVVVIIKKKKNKTENKMALHLTTINETTERGGKDQLRYKKEAPQPPVHSSISRNATRKSIKKPENLTFACV